MPKKENKYKEASEKYRPDKIKILFIAESPPFYKKDEEPRYFYFEKLTGNDSLFREIMKVLYPNEHLQSKKGKIQLLKKFQKNGFFLIDACECPINQEKKKKVRNYHIEKNFPKLKEKIKKLINKDTKIILIKKNVYDLLHKKLKDEKFNVINNKFLPFPSHGHQIKFREKLICLLDGHGFT